MIGSLRGTLLHRGAGELLVEVAGVGYRCQVAPATAVTVGDLGAEVFVHVHHHVREDADTLYAFATLEERATFEALLAAHGVGPALALAILSVHAPAALRQIVADDDVAALCLVPGVGRKTAARLLIELKSGLDIPDSENMGTAVVAAGAGGTPVPSARSEVREALTGLGYGPDEVREVLAGLGDDAPDDSSALLRLALRTLAGGRAVR